jgi:hypothetical protein
MIVDEHKNCHAQKQNEDAPDIGKKPVPPVNPDFVLLLNPGPVGYFNVISPLHAAL